MSTGGVVAVGSLEKWRGVYNHCDSYPTELGQELYEHLTSEMTQGQKTLAEISAAILKFDDWRNYLKGGVCEYCGQIASQPHSISGVLFGKAELGIYPDPECQHHQHEPLDKTCFFTRRDIVAKGCGLEWVYIIEPKASAVHVLDLRRGPAPSRHVGDLTFDAVPDFPVLECGANYERCCHMAWHHFPEIEKDDRQHNLGTGEYLGLEPMADRHSACAFIVKGRRYSTTGSGVNGAYAHSIPSIRAEIQNPDPAAWYEQVKNDQGKRCYIPVSHFTTDGAEEPYPGVTWVFPPTKVNTNESFKGRETASA